MAIRGKALALAGAGVRVFAIGALLLARYVLKLLGVRRVRRVPVGALLAHG